MSRSSAQIKPTLANQRWLSLGLARCLHPTQDALDVRRELADPVGGNAEAHRGNGSSISFGQKIAVAGLPGALGVSLVACASPEKVLGRRSEKNARYRPCPNPSRKFLRLELLCGALHAVNLTWCRALAISQPKPCPFNSQAMVVGLSLCGHNEGMRRR